MIIIIQYLYNALKSCKGHGGVVQSPFASATFTNANTGNLGNCIEN